MKGVIADDYVMTCFVEIPVIRNSNDAGKKGRKYGEIHERIAVEIY